jgi:hypothetical protein
MERWLILFSKRGITMLALLVCVGPVVALHGDARIGLALGGGVFALTGIGQILAARKDSAGGSRCLFYVLGAFVLAFGVFMVAGALLMALTGTPIDVEY